MATIALGIVGYFLAGPMGLSADARTVFVGALMLLATLTVTYLTGRLNTWTTEVGRQYMRERTGIVQTFPNLEACKESMRADLRAAADVSLLLQIGRREIGDGESSYFYSILKDSQNPDSRVRILCASQSSPFLSASRAKHRHSNVERWREDARRLRSEIDMLLAIPSKAKIETRSHNEPYLWRIFIFDNVAYVSGYLYQSDNDSKAVVYRLEAGPDSLLSVFKKYFDYLWLKCDPAITGAETRWERWT